MNFNLLDRNPTEAISDFADRWSAKIAEARGLRLLISIMFLLSVFFAIFFAAGAVELFLHGESAWMRKPDADVIRVEHAKTLLEKRRIEWQVSVEGYEKDIKSIQESLDKRKAWITNTKYEELIPEVEQFYWKDLNTNVQRAPDKFVPTFYHMVTGGFILFFGSLSALMWWRYSDRRKRYLLNKYLDFHIRLHGNNGNA